MTGHPLVEIESELRSGFGGLGFQRVLGDFHQLTKGAGVCGRKIREHLAVEGHFRGFEPFHKPAVSHPGGANGGVDADLPESAESPLLHPAIAESVLAAMINGIGGIAIEFGTAHPEAFGGPDHSGAPFAGSGSVGNAHKSVDGRWLKVDS
jgi:hypothetical protein